MLKLKHLWFLRNVRTAKELCKRARGKDNREAIAEEIADVQIMLEQMMILHDCEDLVEVQKFKKTHRLKVRLEQEE